MPIYIGVNGAVKEVIGGYAGYNGQVVPIYTGNKLPSEYLAVSHIYNEGGVGGGLDTGIIPGVYTKIIYVGAPCGTTRSQCWFKAGEYFYGGSYYESGNRKYYPVGQVAYGSVTGTTSNIEIALVYKTALPDNNKLTILNFNKNTNKESYVKINGTNKVLFANTAPNTYTFSNSIVLCYESDNICSYCIIYQNILNSASPAGEYFPAVRKSDGAAGLYDTVSKKFLTKTTITAGTTINQHSLPNMD